VRLGSPKHLEIQEKHEGRQTDLAGLADRTVVYELPSHALAGRSGLGRRGELARSSLPGLLPHAIIRHPASMQSPDAELRVSRSKRREQDRDTKKGDSRGGLHHG
jgi:hypothetical protein